jgi:ferrous iron transport protein A
MRLMDMKPQETGRIVSLDELDPAVAKKLLDLGMTSGETITFIQRAPLGDPIWIELKGYQLAFRTDIAKHIQVDLKKGREAE